MSNEELAIRIRDGEETLISQLWDQVQKFVAMQAGRYHKRETEDRGNTPGYEIDDLIQESYFALLRAVGYFSPEKGSFLTILDLCLKTAFSNVAGYRTARQRNDGLARSVSGDVPLGEDGNDTLLEILPAGVPDTESAAIEGEYQRQLHNVLEAAMSNLEPRQSDILHRRYYAAQTDAGILETHTNYYAKTGLGEFKRTGVSSVEKIVLRREKLVEKWLKEAKRHC